MIEPPTLKNDASPRFSRAGLVIALIVIATCVILVLKNTALHRAAETSVVGRPNVVMNIVARYLIGIRDVMVTVKQWDERIATQMTSDLAELSRKPADAFRSEIVKAALQDRWPDSAVLNSISSKMPELRDDVAWLGELNALGMVMPDEHWKLLLKRHGWIARLARAQATDWKEADASVLRGEARSTMFALGTAGFIGLFSFLVGIVLFVRFSLRWWRGILRVDLMRTDERWACCFIEAFAIYLFGYTVVLGQVHNHFPGIPSPAIYVIALMFVFIAAFWPRWRGMDPYAWRHAMGLHRGEGWLREMKFGILGWLAGLPLLAVGTFIASQIVRWTGADVTHPIVYELQQPDAAHWGLISLAVIWAPVTEEMMFRGLLFPGLSSFMRWFAGALVAAFIFAVIHPQGWAGVPAVMAIALTMSALRTFRGSLIAPMTAHALNNGLVTALLIAAS